MRCPECQSDNREGVRFCEQCGTGMELTCPSCAATVPLGKNFCGQCGRDLRESMASRLIDYGRPQTYTPSRLAEKILSERSAMEGERKLVTVLFADVANYTSMAELRDPEEVHQIIDGCFHVLMDEIHRYEGTINQFTGDGVMALFGAPVAHEDHAQRACHAALAIQRAMTKYAQRMKSEHGIEFMMRIGLNSGQVIVGFIGDDLRMDYTALGDTTNLASRMESMARPGTVLISGHTHKLVKEFFNFNPLGTVKVKGKRQPQKAYELIEAGEVETRIEASVARGLTKFVGRRGELQALKQAFLKAQSGAGRVVGVVGEAGVGKSRLILELRNELPKEEATCLEGCCLHYGSSMAYLPVLDILRSYFDVTEGEAEETITKKMEKKILDLDEARRDLLPPFQELLSLGVDDGEYASLEPKQKRDKTFEAIRDLLILESRRKPLLLIVEDLHWIDKTSEDLLNYLIEALEEAHVLMVLLYRPEYTPHWEDSSLYAKIALDQLPARASEELVQSILQEAEVAPELRELVLVRTGGNPLFVEELTRTLVENGLIERRGYQYVLGKRASEIDVPDTVRGIIAARMDRLGEGVKRTLQVASVIGRDFAFRILQTITGKTEDLESSLVGLKSLEFIYEKNPFPDLEYIFKHALTQEVAYNSLLFKRRKEIHEAIAGAIEGLYPERLEEFCEVLAYHYSKGENLEKAYQYLKLAAHKAESNYSLWEAFRVYKDTLVLLKKGPRTEGNRARQIEVRLLMAPTVLSLGFPEDSLEILEEGLQLAGALQDKKSLAALHSIIGLYYSIKGEPSLAAKYAENCFWESYRIQDIELMAQTAFDLCTSYSIQGEHFKILDVASRALDLLEESQRREESFGRLLNVYSALCAHCGCSMGVLGDFEEGKTLLEKGLEVSHEIDNLYSLGFMEYFYGHLSAVQGDGKQAIEHQGRAIRYFSEAGAPILLPLCWNDLGWGHYLLGDSEAALSCVEKGLSMQTQSGLAFSLSEFYYYLSMIHTDAGDLARAQGCAEKALELSQHNSEKEYEGLSLVSLGRILGTKESAQGQRAQEYIGEGIRIFNEFRLKVYYAQGRLFSGELYAHAGQREEAGECLEEARGLFKDMGMDYWLERTQRVLERLRR